MIIPIPQVKFRTITIPTPDVDWKDWGMDLLKLTPPLVMVGIAVHLNNENWRTVLAFIAVNVAYRIAKPLKKEQQ